MLGAGELRAMVMAGKAGGLGGRALDFIFPPRCLGCGAGVARQGALCADCWGRLRFRGPPLCDRCGHPFELAPVAPPPGDAPAPLICEPCAARPPRWNRARAVLAYDDGARPLVLGFKHGDRLHGAPSWAAWMARAGAELLAEADLIVPVPLHPWRLMRRRYNQAAVLARALGRRTGRAVCLDMLVRRRSTPSQQGRDRRTRHRNVAGAFAVAPRRAERLAGARLVLVDDVIASGATVGECAQILRAAGASRVDILALARVTKM